MDRKTTFRILVSLIVTAHAVLLVCYLIFMRTKEGGIDAEDISFVLGLLASGTALTTLVTRAMLSEIREQQAVEESRSRLNNAEEALVRAIGSEYNHTSVRNDDFLQHGSSGTGVELPSPREADAGEGAHLTLPALWDTTHARLTHYHNLALQHAKRSFKSAQAAMWAGFLALGGFVWIAFQASTTAGAVVAGGLGAVAAALSGFITKTFIRSQEASADHLRSYFDQPLELSRYLAAERLMASADLTSEQRAEVITALVTAMVAGPQPPQDQQQPEPAPVPQ
ncbi:TRADD-N-associated membrane domain-containing protein, partial [Streptomyces cinereoruber]